MAAEPMADRGAGLPDEAGRELYLAVLAQGGRVPLSAVGPADHEAVDQLVALGLLIPNLIDGAYVAVSPRAVGERIGSEMRSAAADLLSRAERLPTALDPLTRAYDALPRHSDDPQRATYVDGRDRIRHRIAELVSECKQELLTAQPGPRQPATITLARFQDLALVQRGARMRTLYQPSVLGEPWTIGYAAELTGEGAGLRILDESFERMLIIDRSVAVVPAADDYSRAAFISDPAAVAFLVKIFERDWVRADVVQWAEVDVPGVSASVGNRVGRLLAQGLTQRAVATRLGLSERTVAAHISRLRDRYGAQTLFQLGWLMRGSRHD
ncbi:LuxR C-terminal-related transcriptional regulator [Kitasatospora sp. NBC_01539]|uniref:LuxR C-terminal-related transcriptional regulator n=1 Tax=Kitasatospora sp. NBC_01539 TaxID=2903577 RepID=UPI0038603037